MFECEFSDFCELLDIFEPLRIHGSSMLRSWVCLCISVFEEVDRLGSSLEKKDTITGECEHLLS